eukprot:455156-Rhodomonas_salina.1
MIRYVSAGHRILAAGEKGDSNQHPHLHVDSFSQLTLSWSSKAKLSMPQSAITVEAPGPSRSKRTTEAKAHNTTLQPATPHDRSESTADHEIARRGALEPLDSEPRLVLVLDHSGPGHQPPPGPDSRMISDLGRSLQVATSMTQSVEARVKLTFFH